MLPSVQRQFKSSIALANDSLAQLSYQFPRYINFCVDLVQQRVEIEKMLAAAMSCEKCSSCIDKGFQNPVFIDNVCVVPDSDVSLVNSIFRQASTTIYSLENSWQNYRDDANGKMQYLTSKLNTPGDEFLVTYQDFNSSFHFLHVNFTGLNVLSSQLHQSGVSYLSPKIPEISATILEFDTYFRQQTDLFILYVNQNASKYIENGWTKDICRNALINLVFERSTSFAYDWNYHVKSPFDIDNTDAILSQSYEFAYNNSLQLYQCVVGIDQTSASSDIKTAEKCLNTVNFSSFEFKLYKNS